MSNKRPFELCVRDENGCIVAWQAGYTKEEIDEMLEDHPGWYRSLYFLDR